MPADLPDRESADARFARALAAIATYRGKRGGTTDQDRERWLSAHEDLRELLEPMLEQEHDYAHATTIGLPESSGANTEAQPRRFAHFEILASLGGGGMGDVYLARDERLGREVALKMIRPEALWSRDARLRFQRETLAVGRLDHPNICRLYEAGECDGQPFMALQFLAGETLAQSIAGAHAACEAKSLPASAPATRAHIGAIVAMIEKVARALHHAHEHGLVHRDIKPGNIMIGSDGQPVVLDFGLVRDTADLTASLSSSRRGVGTPLYMSPEQIHGIGPIDARTDVYSLGVTLYEALTHERPFDAATEAELTDRILANHYRNPRARNRRLPRELALVIACALDREPDRRYRTALALAEDLRRVLERQPVQARPIGTMLRVRRWAERNPMLLGVSVLAGIALLGLGIATERTIEADNQREVADRRAFEATTNLDMFHLLSDAVRLEEAKVIERTLYPAFPDQAPALRAWLHDRGEPLAARLPILENALLELRGKTASEDERFLRRTLGGLVDALRAFLSEHGELAEVRQRLLAAESVHQTTIEDHRAEWDRAIAAIARSDGVTASKLYDHLALQPQIGLVPIGMDPTSLLWEFAHAASGAIASRDASQGRLAITGETGIVFVLLPGGTFAMGAQRDDPNGRNYDPQAQSDEAPVHDVTLAPFFLAKHELTQGQWQRLTGGEQPSSLPAVTPIQPVESVDGTMCDRLMTEQGFRLPTEAQAEYGCRAGSPTPWRNVAGPAIPLTPKPPTDPGSEQLQRALDPIGSSAANEFGLHDTYGSVFEWCSDGWADYPGTMRPGDGFQLRGSDARTFRNGGAARVAHRARATDRSSALPSYRNWNLGLRPARVLMR